MASGPHLAQRWQEAGRSAAIWSTELGLWSTESAELAPGAVGGEARSRGGMRTRAHGMAASRGRMGPVAKFWMLYAEGGHAPTFRHGSKESAKEEAERLAKLKPGTRVHVLEAVASCVKEEVQWSETRGDPEEVYDDIPF